MEATDDRFYSVNTISQWDIWIFGIKYSILDEELYFHRWSTKIKLWHIGTYVYSYSGFWISIQHIFLQFFYFTKLFNFEFVTTSLLNLSLLVIPLPIGSLKWWVSWFAMIDRIRGKNWFSHELVGNNVWVEEIVSVQEEAEASGEQEETVSVDELLSAVHSQRKIKFDLLSFFM